jgi:hypothetical protein
MPANQAAEKPGTASSFGKLLCRRCAVDDGGGGFARGAHCEKGDWSCYHSAMAKNAHDTGYKLLFSTPELVRDLILGFVPDEWLHSLDYSTLESVPGSYVSEDFSNRADDIVWRVRVGGEWVYLYLLIEFQSRVDKLHGTAHDGLWGAALSGPDQAR